MLTSLALHAFAALLILVGAQTLLRSAPTKKERELDIVFYHPPAIAVPAVPLPLPRGTTAAGAPAGAPAPAVNSNKSGVVSKSVVVALVQPLATLWTADNVQPAVGRTAHSTPPPLDVVIVYSRLTI